MRPVKGGDDAVQNEANPRAATLDSLRTKSDKKGLDASPFQRRWNRLGENGFEGLAVGFVHAAMVIDGHQVCNQILIALTGLNLHLKIIPQPGGDPFETHDFRPQNQIGGLLSIIHEAWQSGQIVKN